MPIVTVSIGKRNEAAFQRAVEDLKANGFTFNQKTKLWSKVSEASHVPRLLQTLREVGLRGTVQDDVKPRIRKE
jgi:hypothetical protein